jgi:serine/threonine protein phosphatase PrpC
MKIYSYTLQGKRDSNEDQHVHYINLNGENSKLNKINFIGVFDGHGGKSISKYLKQNLPQFFINKFNKDLYNNPEQAAKYFIKVYNLIQEKMCKTHPRIVNHCGSTACIGIHYKNNENSDRLWILNVGDSRAIKCNKLNIAEQLTQDHKPNLTTERIRIEELGGKIEFDGSDWRVNNLSLSRAFGDMDCVPYITHIPQIFKYKINSSDKFLIFACDGLWDVVSNQDAVDFINDKISNNFNGNLSKELADYAYNKGSMDNITVIVYLLS